MPAKPQRPASQRRKKIEAAGNVDVAAAVREELKRQRKLRTQALAVGERLGIPSTDLSRIVNEAEDIGSANDAMIKWLSDPTNQKTVVGVNPVDAGPLLQIGAAIVLLAIVALLPGLARVRRLEAAHRSFRVGMEDVSRAYWAAHAADRAGLFALGREFDAVRERLEFLRRHPDLGAHEPELLELAAQMSAEARELAAIYSDEKVARAETMLAERRMEVERLTGLVERAHGVTRDLRRALDEVTLDEDVARARIDRLCEEIGALWDEIERVGTAPPPAEPRLRLAAE